MTMIPLTIAAPGHYKIETQYGHITMAEWCDREYARVRSIKGRKAEVRMDVYGNPVLYVDKQA